MCSEDSGDKLQYRKAAHVGSAKQKLFKELEQNGRMSRDSEYMTKETKEKKEETKETVDSLKA